MRYFLSKVIYLALFCGAITMALQSSASELSPRQYLRALELMRLSGFDQSEVGKSRTRSSKRDLPTFLMLNDKHYKIEMLEKGYFQWSEEGVVKCAQGYGRYQLCDSFEKSTIAAFSNFLNCSMMISDIAREIKIEYCDNSTVKISIGNRIAVVSGNEYVFVDGAENMEEFIIRLLNN